MEYMPYKACEAILKVLLSVSGVCGCGWECSTQMGCVVCGRRCACTGACKHARAFVGGLRAPPPAPAPPAWTGGRSNSVVAAAERWRVPAPWSWGLLPGLALHRPTAACTHGTTCAPAGCCQRQAQPRGAEDQAGGDGVLRGQGAIHQALPAQGQGTVGAKGRRGGYVGSVALSGALGEAGTRLPVGSQGARLVRGCMPPQMSSRVQVPSEQQACEGIRAGRTRPRHETLTPRCLRCPPPCPCPQRLPNPQAHLPHDHQG